MGTAGYRVTVSRQDPLTTAVSSLPEAGGDLAEYFDLRSEHDMLAKLERLIDDTSYREGREANIRQCFRPRNWVDIADEIVQRALDQETGSAVHPTLNRVQSDEIWPLPAEVGRYYPLSRSCETSIWTGTMGGEMYRIGQGWWSPDDWGTWLKREVADIAFTIAEAGNHPHLVYLGLRGGPGKPADYRIDVIGSGAQEDGVLDPEEHRWVVLTIESEAVRDAVIQIRLTTTGRCDLAEATHGEDRRIVTPGMLGFYVCREDDLLARHRFIEALQLKRLHCLSGRRETASIALKTGADGIAIGETAASGSPLDDDGTATIGDLLSQTLDTRFD